MFVRWLNRQWLTGAAGNSPCTTRAGLPLGRWRMLAGLLALLFCCQAPVLMAEPASLSSQGITEIWLEVRVNGTPAPYALLMLQRPDGSLLAKSDDLSNWDFHLPHAPSITHMGQQYIVLDGLPGLGYQLDEASLTLSIDAGPGLFVRTELGGVNPEHAEPMPSSAGGFFNYDLFASRAAGINRSSGLFEAGFFSGSGVGISSFLARQQPRPGSPGGGDEFGFTRLETTWTRDMPGMRATLRLGDAISSAGSWGRSVRFAGAQWGTNFATQPGFITFPLPDMSGEAVLPSTLDLYVNGVLRMRDEVPTGPFTVNSLPVVTGQGDVQMVLRDMLGREQVFSGNFYASSRLLKQGLSDFSYEVGAIRDNYGLESFAYGRWMAAGTHRWGVTDQLTAELRAELLSGQQSVGVGGAYLWGNLGVVRASVAGSHSALGSGGLLDIGFERSGLGLSFGFSTQLASKNFTRLGQQAGERAPKRLSQVFISAPLQRFGSLSLNYLYQHYRDRETFESLGVSYQVSLGRLGFLGASAMRFFGQDSHTLYALTFTRALGRSTTASASYNYEDDASQLLMQVQRNLPVGTGFGYRLAAGALDSDRFEAGLSAQTDYGTYSAEVSRFNGQTSYNAGISGGLAVMGGSVHLSRRITDSFAVVKVGDYANVRIYADNQEVARTRADGTALLPRLRAYEENPVTVELADLPMDAQIDGRQLNVVPYFRSGLALEFPIRRARGAIFSVVLDNGDPLPVGVMVTRLADQQQFVTGLRGEVYITGLAERERLRVSWKGQSCEFTVAYPETDNPLPKLGNHLCAGVKP